MNTLYAYALRFACLSFALAQSATAADQKLNWVEIINKTISTQVLFDFAGKFTYQKKLDPTQRKLTLSFSNMTFANFDRNQIMQSLTTLKETGLIHDVHIAQEQAKNQTQFTLIFNQKSSPVLVKLSHVQGSNRLAIEFYPRHKLDKLTNKNVLLYASNDIIQSDSLPLAGKKKNHRPVIMLDPGHGGNNMGARGFGNIWEKNVTLAIARMTHKMLKKLGYKSVLSRQDDRALELLERSQRAQEEGANLFVSIHANSSGSRSNDAYGVETFYMQNNDLLSTSKATGYLFINCAKDQSLIKTIDQHLATHELLSKSLATNIQSHLLKTLDDEGLGTQNRGVKRGEFRVFLQSGMPSALVEVGFLTNQQESERLAKHSYRKLIAQGICKGIVRHIETQSL